MDTTEATKETIEKVLEQRKKNKKGMVSSLFKAITIYIFPISAVISFFVIMFFFVIPKIVNIISSVDHISQLNAELDLRKEDLANLQRLSEQEDELNDTIEALNSLAPTGDTAVVEFQGKLASLAKDFNLVMTSSESTENSIAQNSLSSNDTLLLREIPNNFEINGQDSNMFEFINALSKIDDFVVVEEMELSADSQGNWSMSINLIKYQFSEGQDKVLLNEGYLNVPITAKMNESVREYIQSRILGTSDSQ